MPLAHTEQGMTAIFPNTLSRNELYRLGQIGTVNSLLLSLFDLFFLITEYVVSCAWDVTPTQSSF